MARLFHEVGVVALILLLAAAGRAGAQQQNEERTHLGVIACSGNTCHGAVERLKGSSVAQNEYLIWSQEADKQRIDKHHRAYKVLLSDRAKQIAQNLGLTDAANSKLCLKCHADYVDAALRGPQFKIEDGVGCEACHGAAEKWLGPHYSRVPHDIMVRQYGLTALEKPMVRAEKCLSCHFGNPDDDNRFVSHRIMGAGHPRMGFELDTYTAAEPAHFTVDEGYIKRKGPVNGVQVWAVGQAANLVERMDALLKHPPKGVQPELVLFDCVACHHTINQVRWRPRRSTGLGPGTVKLDDANAVMLRVIAARVAPATAKALAAHMLALHRATTEDWKTVVREATEVRGLAIELRDSLSAHDFTRDDMKALAEGVIAVGLTGDDTDFPGADQATMALGSIASAMSSPVMADHLTAEQTKVMNDALRELYKSISDAETYRPEAFVKALKDFQKTIPR
jgi:hypothetical protein